MNSVGPLCQSINLSDYKINNNYKLLKQCEICYTDDDNLIDILNANFRGNSLSEMLDNFPSIKDYRLIEYSFNLCLICVKQFICSYLFLEKVQESNKKFKGLVKLSDRIDEHHQLIEETVCQDTESFSNSRNNYKKDNSNTDDDSFKKDNYSKGESNSFSLVKHSCIENMGNNCLNDEVDKNVVKNIQTNNIASGPYDTGEEVIKDEVENVQKNNYGFINDKISNDNNDSEKVTDKNGLKKNQENDNIKDPNDTFRDEINIDEVEKIHIFIEQDEDAQQKQFICYLCDAGFARKQGLDFHIRRIHLNEKKYLCSTCGKQFFLRVDYNRHISLHTGKTSHVCNLCGKGFVADGLLKSHKNTVHKDKELKCDHCPKMFKLQVQLKRHIMTVHNMLPQERKSLGIKEKVDCKVCGKKLNKYVLRTHMERHSGSKKYQCEICGQEFFQQVSFNNHMIRHQDPKFSCEYCGKCHFTKQEMLTHIRRQHTREIVCSCEHCHKGFVHKTNLIQHIRNCHPGENETKFIEPKIPKQCTVCGKIYSSRTSLIHHRRRAHENKQYSCTECDTAFKNLVPFKSHLKKIHNIGNTYVCDICSKTFYTREDLYKHRKRTHTIGTSSLYLCCTVCQIKFKTKHELIQHIQSKHLNDANSTIVPVLYECNICVTIFLGFDIFKEHVNNHHPDKIGDESVTSEYEIGGCKVQCFQYQKISEHTN